MLDNGYSADLWLLLGAGGAFTPQIENLQLCPRPSFLDLLERRYMLSDF